jgi:hypothetical protein
MTMPSFIVQQNEKFKEANTAEFYIEITEGDYTGLSFVFGPIEFIGEDEDGNGRVKFDYHLLETPEFVILEEHREEIESVIGSVLHKILEDMSNTPEGENTDEIGNVDSEQPAEG